MKNGKFRWKFNTFRVFIVIIFSLYVWVSCSNRAEQKNNSKKIAVLEKQLSASRAKKHCNDSETKQPGGCDGG